MQILLTAGSIALTMIFATGTSSRADDTKTDQASSKAELIADVGELGENIYDLAKDKDWAKVDGKLTALKSKVPELHSQDLNKALTALATSVSAKDLSETMQHANKITLIATELSEPFHPQIPTDISRLDYYGRELQIWAAEKDNEKLKESAAALQKTWSRVSPSVKEHGGSAQAKTFDGLVKKLKKAKSPKQYAAAAGPILDEVDNLEKVFSK
jgi:hypothetical protein